MGHMGGGGALSLAAARALASVTTPPPACVVTPPPASRGEVDFLITLDAETYWAPGYDLKKCGTAGYIRDDRFQEIGWGVKWGSNPAYWFTPTEFAAWAKQVPWHRCAVACHNTRFDGFILAERYGVRPALWVDTLSMARALHPAVEVGGSLAKLAKHYGLGEKGTEVLKTKGKRLEDFSPEDYARFGAYCVQDVALTYALFLAMAKVFPEEELWVIDTTLRMFLEPTFLLEENILRALIVAEQKRKADLLEKTAQDKSLLMSNDKFARLLMEQGVEPPMKLSPAALKKGEEKYTFAFAKSDPGMQELLDHDDPIVAALAAARIALKSTINETRAERFLKLGEGGRKVPVALNYAAAHTFRWGGAEKTNFQNLVRGGELRKSLLVPEGKVLVVPDLSQIEPRVTAWLAGHEALLDVFRRNDADKDGDVYSDAGSEFFGRKITKKTDPLERQASKSMLIGLGYQMGWRKFATVLLKDGVQFSPADAERYGVDIDAFEARHATAVEEMISKLRGRELLVHCAVTKYFVDKYRDVNAPIKALWGQMGDVLDAMDAGAECFFGPVSPAFPKGCLKTRRHGILLPNGLVLRYPGLEQGERGYTYMGGKGGRERVKAYGGSMTENVVQALARIVIAGHMLQCRRELGLHLVSTSHDELAFVTDEARGEEMLAACIAVMRRAPEWAPGLPLNAAGDVGRSYGDAK